MGRRGTMTFNSFWAKMKPHMGHHLDHRNPHLTKTNIIEVIHGGQLKPEYKTTKMNITPLIFVVNYSNLN